MKEPSKSFSRWRIWALRVLLLILFIAAVLLLRSRPLLPFADFIQYWSAGRLNLAGQNPYSMENMLAIQRTMGWSGEIPVMMWNPPWVLVLVTPFSLFDFTTDHVLWYFFQVGSIVFCADALWRHYKGPQQLRWLAGLVTLLTASTIFLLVLGQISFLILLGSVLFLVLSDKNRPLPGLTPCSRDLLAGASILLISVKPQAFYLFWPVWLAWALLHRRYYILAGAIISLIISLLISLATNPIVLTQYLGAVQSQPPDYWATPTIGYWLRVVFGMEKFWLQFLPVLLGLAWSALYFWQRRWAFSWSAALPILAFASLITSAYTWTYDQIILLPAQIEITTLLTRKGWMPRVIALTVTWFTLQTFLLAFHLRQSDEIFIWQAPLLFLFYLAGRLV